MKKILIVEDSQLYYKFFKRVIKDANIIWAKNGMEAMEIYKKEKPSLVLVDIILPRMDGIELIKNIKAMDENARVVVLTGLDQEDVIKDALKAGAMDYITKDTDIEELRNKILEKMH